MTTPSETLADILPKAKLTLPFNDLSEGYYLGQRSMLHKCKESLLKAIEDGKIKIVEEI